MIVKCLKVEASCIPRKISVLMLQSTRASQSASPFVKIDSKFDWLASTYTVFSLGGDEHPLLDIQTALEASGNDVLVLVKK